MCEKAPSADAASGAEGLVAFSEARVRYLEARVARYEPEQAVRIDDLLDGPQRSLSPEEVERQTKRFVEVCATQGVGAVVVEVATCRELLHSLAEACHHAGLTSAAQYLHYLDAPHD